MDEFIAAICVIAIILGALLFDAVSCDSRWKDSGFSHRWSVSGGCQIKFHDGTWIPSENYRGI